MRIYLIRHGETAHNRDGLGLGRADVPLSDHGRRQAEALGARLANLPIDRLYASPLGRCLETARYVAGERALTTEVEPALVELDVGETEGLSFPSMRERFAGFLQEWQGPEGHLVRMPGGESIADLDARVTPFIEHLFSLETESVAVVSHNFVIRVMVARMLGLEAQAFRAINLDLASICTLERRRNTVVVHVLNDHCHTGALEH